MKKWHYKKFGGISHIEIVSGDDIASLAELDRKEFLAISCPVNGVRADEKMLSMIDTDNDGRIRIGEVIGAVDYLKSKGHRQIAFIMMDCKQPEDSIDVQERQTVYKKWMQKHIHPYIRQRSHPWHTARLHADNKE